MTTPKGPPERVMLYRYRESPYVREARTDDKMEEHAYLLESSVLSERAAHAEETAAERDCRLANEREMHRADALIGDLRAEVARLREALELLTSGIYHGREVVDLAERALAPQLATAWTMPADMPRTLPGGVIGVPPATADHYPIGMGEESRRLHREYNALVTAQRNGAKNGAEVVRLTDECAVKGIILVPGGENL